MSRMVIPVGPQHPLLKEPLSFTLEIEAERVMEARMRIGYVHRGIERLCEQMTYPQVVHLVERICGICSHAHTTCFCQAVEALAGLDVPRRGAAIRVLLCELERIHSHLLWLGVLAEAVGFTTIFMYAWRDRELVLELMEDLSGGRVSHSVNVVGGVRVDVSEAQVAQLHQGLEYLAGQIAVFRGVVARDRSFRRRTHGLGVISREVVHAQGLVGPMARASGCDLDIRRAAPYALYGEMRFKPVVVEDGDVWARAQVRLEEIPQSVELCRQALDQLGGAAASGDLSARAPRRIPAGEALSRIEAPRGELMYYVRSDDSDRPARVKARTPTLPTLRVLVDLLPGAETADVAAIIAGADLCIACADR